MRTKDGFLNWIGPMGGHIQLGFLYGYINFIHNMYICIHILYIYSHIDPVCIYIIMIMIMINYANCSYYFLYFFGGDEPNLC